MTRLPADAAAAELRPMQAPRPLRSILLPVDGSWWSARTLSLAGTLGRASGARLHVVSVFLHFPPGARVPELGGFAGPSEEDLIEAEREGVVRTADRLSADAGVEATGVLLTGQGGSTVRGENACVAERLLEYVGQHDVDLIVMATHGRSGVSRAWLGSVADALVRQSPVPVLLVRPQAVSEPGAITSFSHILLPLDGSALGDQIVGDATTIAALLGARVTLMRVLTRGEPAGPHDEACRHLDATAEAMREAGVTVGTQLYALERPAEAILDAARQRRADLIALSTHGRGGVQRLLLGSVADKVIRGSDCAVLVRRPLP